jgi:ribosomal protein S12 methylthiotransferase
MSKRLTIISDATKQEVGTSCATGGTPYVPQQEGFVIQPVREEGFAGNVTLVTLGCAKNEVDSEVMLGALSRRGFRAVGDPKLADLIVVNTCAFLESAVQEGIDVILEMSELKKTARCRKLVVAGCMVERYRDKLQQSMPEVDRFVSTDELLTIADDSTTEECLSEARRPYFLYDESMPRVRSATHSSYIKIAEGCNRPCAFCIIPKIRGEFRSRSMESVVAEATLLLEDRVKEINLIAQDLTSFGVDRVRTNLKLSSPLTELLRELEALDKISDEFWVRLLYAYPIGVNEELIKVIRDSKHIAKYLDMPLQHISHNVLKQMRRPLGEVSTRKLIEEIRRTAPEIALRTTFIVGFPGETEEDIASLELFVKEGHFRHVGVFPYSDESESVAFGFEGKVPKTEIKRRLDRIMQAQQQIVAKNHTSYVGKELRVLIDGSHAESDMLLSARSEWHAPETDGEIIINDFADRFRDGEGDVDVTQFHGKFATARITEVAGYDLVGEIVSV